jgi:hypothetical protein
MTATPATEGFFNGLFSSAACTAVASGADTD